MNFLLESDGLLGTTTLKLNGKVLGLVKQCIFEADIENGKLFCEIYRVVPVEEKEKELVDIPNSPGIQRVKEDAMVAGEFQMNMLDEVMIEKLCIFPVDSPGMIEETKFDEDHIKSKKLIISSEGSLISTKIYLYGHHIPGLQRFKVIVNAGEPILIEIKQMLLPDVKDQDINVFGKEDFESPTTIAKKKPE